MKVYKFGGASVSSIERIKATAAIAKTVSEELILIVISAMGKTTNALERVAEAFYGKQRDEAINLFTAIKVDHLSTAKQLLAQNYLETESRLAGFFTEIEWMLYDNPVREYDYYYDQIVCIGELLSTAIVSAYFNEVGITNTWIDVRDVLRSDDEFREATIDWNFSLQRTELIIQPLLQSIGMVITQGFIAATDENESTTLGREGSDYTAAVFANMLNAESLTIWKDVKGVLNADPRQFKEAALISELNYKEVLEMAYYGAQVIHPKTIKPLQNKNIPMYVKCFLDSSLPGTIIHDGSIKALPPIIVIKTEQVLLQMTSNDFSFISDQVDGQFYRLFQQYHIKPNITQNGAISFVCVIDDHAEKINTLALDLSQTFNVQIEKNLTLITIKHYTQDVLDELTLGKHILLKQQWQDTVQIVIR
ncbi:MAG: aspartate kinase [Chitinophagaceae bacterium]|nr:aspartate kinase [Chitinophagaceae bacterium]